MIGLYIGLAIGGLLGTGLAMNGIQKRKDRRAANRYLAEKGKQR